MNDHPRMCILKIGKAELAAALGLPSGSVVTATQDTRFWETNELALKVEGAGPPVPPGCVLTTFRLDEVRKGGSAATPARPPGFFFKVIGPDEPAPADKPAEAPPGHCDTWPVLHLSDVDAIMEHVALCLKAAWPDPFAGGWSFNVLVRTPSDRHMTGKIYERVNAEYGGTAKLLPASDFGPPTDWDTIRVTIPPPPKRGREFI